MYLLYSKVSIDNIVKQHLLGFLYSSDKKKKMHLMFESNFNFRD